MLFRPPSISSSLHTAKDVASMSGIGEIVFRRRLSVSAYSGYTYYRDIMDGVVHGARRWAKNRATPTASTIPILWVRSLKYDSTDSKTKN